MPAFLMTGKSCESVAIGLTSAYYTKTDYLQEDKRFVPFNMGANDKCV